MVKKEEDLEEQKVPLIEPPKIIEEPVNLEHAPLLKKKISVRQPIPLYKQGEYLLAEEELEQNEGQDRPDQPELFIYRVS